MLDNMEYGGGGGAFPPFADPGPLFCVASKQNRRCTTGSFGSASVGQIVHSGHAQEKKSHGGAPVATPALVVFITRNRDYMPKLRLTR